MSDLPSDPGSEHAVGSEQELWWALEYGDVITLSGDLFAAHYPVPDAEEDGEPPLTASELLGSI